MPRLYVPIKPELLKWARERNGMDLASCAKVRELKKVPAWESGEVRPTLNELENFAEKVHVPIGYLFLSEPPVEKLPIPDYRTVRGSAVTRPSANLLDTIYTCQERQDWYRSYLESGALGSAQRLPFVGSADTNSSVEEVAERMRLVLNFTSHRTPGMAGRVFSILRQRAEDLGILVMVNKYVKNSTSRRLKVSEFRGFALVDSWAPLVFVNAGDAKVAQLFTLSHELAHIWLGQSALSNSKGERLSFGKRRDEVWCNRVAAEFLVPVSDLRQRFTRLGGRESLEAAVPQLGKAYKVSGKVVLLRLLHSRLIKRTEFRRIWKGQELERPEPTPVRPREIRINPYKLIWHRSGRRFASALVESTLEGKTSYRSACQMLGISSVRSFVTFSEQTP